MSPSIFWSMRRHLICPLIAALCVTATAQTDDAPPVNADQMLNALRQLREQGSASLKARRAGALHVRRPALLRGRALELMTLGERNRAIAEMYNLIKTFPQHPEAAQWTIHLESILIPEATTPPPGGAQTVSPVTAPRPIPSGARPVSQ